MARDEEYDDDDDDLSEGEGKEQRVGIKFKSPSLWHGASRCEFLYNYREPRGLGSLEHTHINHLINIRYPLKNKNKTKNARFLVVRKRGLKLPKLVLTGPSPVGNLPSTSPLPTSPIPTSPPLPTIEITFAPSDGENRRQRGSRSFRRSRKSSPESEDQLNQARRHHSERRRSDVGPRRRTVSESSVGGTPLDDNDDDGDAAAEASLKAMARNKGGFLSPDGDAFFSTVRSGGGGVGGPGLLRRAVSEEPPDNKVHSSTF